VKWSNVGDRLSGRCCLHYNIHFNPLTCLQSNCGAVRCSMINTLVWILHILWGVWRVCASYHWRHRGTAGWSRGLRVDRPPPLRNRARAVAPDSPETSQCLHGRCSSEQCAGSPLRTTRTCAWGRGSQERS